jgi:hypothetical protein
MLLDLSLVTQTLESLIFKLVTTSPEAAKVTPLTISAQPPDKLTGDHTIGIYLYHITEDAQYKNLAPSSPDLPPVRFIPMGLDLYYIITGHSDLSGEVGTQNEQTMLGLAMKALHDYPVVDDSTTVGGLKVFPAALQGTDNRFRIVLQPVQHTEAMTYWTAGSLPMRLALYYQVSIVLLEPDQPASRTGRVLTYGLYGLARGAPHLDGSQSTATFTLPGGSPPRTVTLQPAEAPINGRVTFIGSDLAGDQTTLLIKSLRFFAPVEVGTDWGVIAGPAMIYATIQAWADSNTIVPGMYSAVAKVTSNRVMPDNSVRPISTTSNEVPFVVTPLVQSVSVPDALMQVTVQGGVFKDAGIAADAVDVFVGPIRLSPKAGAVLNPGEFEVVDASTLRFRYPIAGLNSGAVVPFRLIVNGAESAPNWVTVP